MSRRFEGKVAFVTGASSGIGASVALELARQGAKVALAARRPDRLEQDRKQIEDAGGTAIAVACDVTDRACIDTAVKHTVEAFGRIDVVLANAGYGVSGNALKLTTDDFRRQFSTNVFGVIDTLYATLPHLQETKGCIGIVGSIMGRVGMPASAPYCASKFAVAGLAEALYYDLAERGVAITCINPGLVTSEIRSVNNAGVYTGKPDRAPAWLVMPAETAAKQIVRALHRRKPELVVTTHGKLIVFLAHHFPRFTRLVLRTATKGRLAEVQRAKRGEVA